jgi:hypothetical protein
VGPHSPIFSSARRGAYRVGVAIAAWILSLAVVPRNQILPKDQILPKGLQVGQFYPGGPSSRTQIPG